MTLPSPLLMSMFIYMANNNYSKVHSVLYNNKNLTLLLSQVSSFKLSRQLNEKSILKTIEFYFKGEHSHG